MSDDAGSRRSGRRDNGLTAAAYLPLADLDPWRADALLESLRAAGVAAYVTPSTGRQGGYLEVTLPDRPTDRLWVDSAARPQAARVMAAELSDRPPEGEPAAVDEEASWRAIVATFQAKPAGTPTWPVAEEVGDGPATGRLVRRAEPAEPAYGSPEPAYGSVSPAHDTDSDPADDDHYVPPVPPPVPQPQPVTRWAMLALVGGLAVLVLPALFSDPVGPGITLLAILAVLGGFVTLVARMRDAPPTDSGPDDGAVV